jgi:hypothetical protein
LLIFIAASPHRSCRCCPGVDPAGVDQILLRRHHGDSCEQFGSVSKPAKHPHGLLSLAFALRWICLPCSGVRESVFEAPGLNACVVVVVAGRAARAPQEVLQQLVRGFVFSHRSLAFALPALNRTVRVAPVTHSMAWLLCSDTVCAVNNNVDDNPFHLILALPHVLSVSVCSCEDIASESKSSQPSDGGLNILASELKATMFMLEEVRTCFAVVFC